MVINNSTGIAEVPEAEIANDLGGAMPIVGKWNPLTLFSYILTAN